MASLNVRFQTYLRVGVCLVKGCGHGTTVRAGIGQSTSGCQGTGCLSVWVQGQIVKLKWILSKNMFPLKIISMIKYVSSGN